MKTESPASNAERPKTRFGTAQKIRIKTGAGSALAIDGSVAAWYVAKTDLTKSAGFSYLCMYVATKGVGRDGDFLLGFRITVDAHGRCACKLSYLDPSTFFHVLYLDFYSLDTTCSARFCIKPL
jgi:hypothetical protein